MHHLLALSRSATVLLFLVPLLTAPRPSTTPTPLVQLSAPPPSPGCVDNGKSSRNLNVEPYLAANPKSLGTGHTNLIAVWYQVRSTSGSVAASSFDGGKTWTQTPLPFSPCAPGGPPEFATAGDPWVSFGPDGRAYAGALGLYGPSHTNAILAATSTDGGRTWSNVRKIIDDDNSLHFNDKDSIIADPTRAGVAYAVWDRQLPHPSTINPDSGSAWLARTTDGGKTWQRPKQVIPATRLFTILGAEILVDPRTHALYLTYGAFANQSHTRLRSTTLCRKQNVQRSCTRVRHRVKSIAIHAVAGFVKSSDGGATWSKPRTIGTILTATGRLPAWPYVDEPSCTATPLCFRTGSFLPQAELDPADGKLYVLWTALHPKGAEIELSSTHDGGAHWSAPTQVSPPVEGPAFTPSIAVNARRAVGVTYYTHSRSSGSKLPTDYWFRSSTDGGAHFHPPIHLAGPFDHALAPKWSVNGYFLGDYMALASAGTIFYPIFVMTNAGPKDDATDVFIASVK